MSKRSWTRVQVVDVVEYRHPAGRFVVRSRTVPAGARRAPDFNPWELLELDARAPAPIHRGDFRTVLDAVHAVETRLAAETEPTVRIPRSGVAFGDIVKAYADTLTPAEQAVVASLLQRKRGAS